MLYFFALVQKVLQVNMLD